MRTAPFGLGFAVLVASSTLAQAEALAIFAREGVDLATRWVAPADGSRIEDAFSLYLNYDGAGGRVQGQSVRATSSSVDQVGAYAVVSPSNVLYLLLFNKDTASRTVAATVAGGAPASLALYRFTAAARLASAGTAAPAAGVLSLTLPARSATLAVGTLGTPVGPFPFYTLPPCRIVDTRNAAGEFGGPALAAMAARTFAPSGRCGIPASAKALSVNVSVTGSTALGNLVVYPGGVTPPATATVNYAASATRANNAVVGLGAGTALTARANQASGTVHLIVDVNGYFE